MHILNSTCEALSMVNVLQWLSFTGLHFSLCLCISTKGRNDCVFMFLWLAWQLLSPRSSFVKITSLNMPISVTLSPFPALWNKHWMGKCSRARRQGPTFICPEFLQLRVAVNADLRSSIPLIRAGQNRYVLYLTHTCLFFFSGLTPPRWVFKSTETTCNFHLHDL